MQDYIYKHLFVGNSGKEVIYLGYRLNLTPAEYKIIRLIIEKEQIGTDELYREFEKSFTKGNIAVHICSINKKAAMIGGRKLIEYKNRCYFFNPEM